MEFKEIFGNTLKPDDGVPDGEIRASEATLNRFWNDLEQIMTELMTLRERYEMEEKP